MKKTIPLLCFAMVSPSLLAEDEKLFLGIKLSSANLDIKDSYAISDQRLNKKNLEIGYGLGYRFKSNLSLHLEFMYNDSIDILRIGDTYNLFQYRTLAGYALDISETIKFVPKAGFSFWELDGEEGSLLNPGVEETFNYSGNSFIWTLGLEFEVSEHFNIELGYENNDHDFGSNESLNLGLTYGF